MGCKNEGYLGLFGRGWSRCHINGILSYWTFLAMKPFREKRNYGLAILITAIILIAVIFVFFYIRTWEQRALHSRFGKNSEILAQTLQNSFDNYLEILEYIDSFYKSKPVVSRNEFDTFVKRELQNRSGIQALEWIPLVLHENRDAFESLAKKDGFPHFSFTQRKEQGEMISAKQRPEYFPVFYVAPFDSNKLAFGFDLGSNPARRKALDAARDSGKMVATERIKLVQEVGEQYGFLIFKPIYHQHLLNSGRTRHDSLKGFGLAVFRIGHMVESSLKNFEHTHIGIQLTDASVDLQKSMLYMNATYEKNRAWLDGDKAISWTRNFNIAGRDWTVRFAATPQYIALYQSQQSWILLGGGLLFTGLLFNFLILLTKRANRIEALANELTEKNQQLVDNQHRLIQSEKMASLGRLAAGVAHEINNPIGFVQSNLMTMESYATIFKTLHTQHEGLLNELTDTGCINTAKAIDHLTTIKSIQEREKVSLILRDIDPLVQESLEGTRRVIEIVKGLKNFTQSTTPDLVEADINAGVEATLKIVWNEIKYKCEIETNLGPIPSILCFPGQLNQVFLNLVTNAAHSHDKKGKITIETSELGGEIVIRVSDTGCGIPQDHMHQLFDPFFTTKSEGEGTGLGLFIAYGIVKKHHGVIEVESEVGKGSTFTVRLPIETQP